ncbi:MAG: Do family serine endopeptidase [Gemmatimonadetes bacterium]|nr:Do family serine endopeptidase [Gemmatimonadota bacterium]
MSKLSWRTLRYLGLVGLLAACRGEGDLHAQGGQARLPVRDPLRSAAAVDTTTAFRLSNTFRAAADRALPAVVAIQVVAQPQLRTRGQAPEQVPEQFRRFFEQFGFGNPDPSEMPPQRGLGSGFIIDESGHIMTNHHVVNGATRITVRTLDGRDYDAKLVGSDPNTDVAIIKIEPRRGERLPVSDLGDSDATRVGDWVLALGNPLGFNFTVTAGIVSAKGRQLERNNEQALEAYIQTDAAINPGNSGGPLVDLFGRVVAVNTAIQGPQFIGYGFSVPIDLARRVADDLIKQGYVRRPRIGVRISPLSDADAEVYGLSQVKGALVRSVEQGQPAERAGIRPGDVVLALNGRPIEDATDLTTSLARLQPGENVQLTVWRDRRQEQVTMRLGEFERSAARSTPAAADEAAHATRLGFTAQAITPQLVQQYELSAQQGLVITTVNDDGPAAGQVAAGQQLLSVNGQRVRNMAELTRAATAIQPGSVISLLVRDRQLGEMVVNYRAR